MDDRTLPRAVLDQIEVVCVAFDQACRSGTPPSVDHYLTGVAEELRPVLRPRLDSIAQRHFTTGCFAKGYRRAEASDSRGDRPTPGNDAPTRAWEDSTGGDAQSTLPQRDFTGVVSSKLHASSKPPRAPAELLPRSFGEYTLLSILGRGGMGIVYLARQESAGRLVALKLIPPEQLAGLKPLVRDELLVRFRTEALAAAQLQHEQIVTVFDVGEFDGQSYYAMRYVEGPGLVDILADGPLENHRAAAYLEPVARAVHVVHRRGILHRDIKPRNLLCDRSTDRLLVADFGLAKLLEHATDVTHTGQCIGTPSYMSPEQARDASQVAATTDVYGLGATLYHMLVGRPPFQAATLPQTIRQVTDQLPVAPRELNSAIDRDLDTICLKCLEKDPARRYSTAEDLADDLGRYLRREPIRARRVGPIGRAHRWCRRNPVVAALLGLVFVSLLAGTVVSVYFALDARAQAAAASLSAATARNESTRADHEAAESRRRLARMNVDEGWRLHALGDRPAALARFVEALSIQRDQPERVAVHRRRLALLLRDLPRVGQLWLHPGPIAYAEFSPEGQRVVAAGMDGTARVFDARSGSAIGPPLAHKKIVPFACFNHSGEQLLTASWDESAKLWDIASGNAVIPAFEPGEPVLHAAFSPDGRLIATASGKRLGYYGVLPPLVGPNGQLSQRKHVSYVKLWNAATGRLVAQLEHTGWVQYVEFSPDGSRLVAAVGQLENSSDASPSYAQVWDVASASKVGKRIIHEDEVLMARFSPDGSLVATASGDSGGAAGEARLWHAATGDPATSPLEHGSRVCHVEFSSDGARLLTASWDKSSRQWNVASGEPLGDPLGGGPFTHDAEIVEACYSPDGRWIATGDRSGLVRTWSSQPGAAAGQSLWHSAEIARLQFTHDGAGLLVGCADGTLRIWDLPAPNGPIAIPPERIANEKNGNEKLSTARFLADGRLIVHSGTIVIHTLTGARGAESYRQVVPRRTVLWDAELQGQVASWGDAGAIAHADYARRRAVTFSIQANSSVVRTCDLETGKPLGPEIKCPSNVNDAVMAADGSRIFTAADDKTVRIWDSATGSEVASPLLHEHGVERVVLSQSNRWLVAVVKPQGRRPTTTQVWNATTAQAVSPPRDHGYSIEDVVFHPQSELFAVLGDKVEIYATDTPASGKPLATIRQAARSATFSRDGKLLLTFGASDSARVWNPRTGEGVSPPLKHAGEVRHAAFSADGHLVATASADRTARLWDAQTGEPISPPFEHPDLVWHVAFDEPAHEKTGRLVTACADDQARVWALPEEDRTIEVLADLAAVISGRQMDETGGLAPLTRNELHRKFGSPASP